MTRHILRIDASMRRAGSTSRALADELIARLAPGEIAVRDLADGVEIIDEAWIDANFTDPGDRTAAQSAALGYSDELVEELEAADEIVIAAPIYNFGVPAALKAWVDQIARAKRTFRYTADGPEGLLKGKKAWLIVASGGTPAGAEIDFATGYMRQALSFVGIDDVTLVDGSALGRSADDALARARAAMPAA